MTFTDVLRTQTLAAVAALGAVSRDVVSYQTLSDETLLAVAACTAEQQRLVGAHAVIVAGEIARRSAPHFGSEGLAQRTGHRTPQELVRVTTGQSSREAAATVRAGLNSQDAALTGSIDSTTGELFVAASPWMLPVGTAFAAGTITVAAADAIRNGLGIPSANVPESQLGVAVEWLCEAAITLDADRLYQRARQFRDEIDAGGIADREQERYAARSLTLLRLRNGMSRLTWIMDPETAATVTDLFDRATSPRRGGPRFVSTDNRRLSEQITDDVRSTEQFASDVFAQLLRHGADADSSQLLASGAPVVRMLVAQSQLLAGERSAGVDSPAQPSSNCNGFGHIEGQSNLVSIQTIDRIVCAGSVTPILFDETGQALDVGREQRLFTRRQRVALAARDGGCRFPGCERPPSWTEAHHIRHWARDSGPTNIADGILFCKHHHLLIHNNHWEITRTASDYWLIPPPDIDPNQTFIPLPTKSGAMRELLRG